MGRRATVMPTPENTMAEDKLRIWVTATLPQRYFLIPEGKVLAPGALKLQDNAVHFVSVDESEAAPFEVTVRQARKWFEANRPAVESEQAARRAQLERMKGQLESLTAWMQRAVESEETKQWMARFGIDAQKLLSDPQGAQQLGLELQKIARASTGQPAAAAELRAVLQRFGHPGSTGDELAAAKELTTRLTEWLGGAPKP